MLHLTDARYGLDGGIPYFQKPALRRAGLVPVPSSVAPDLIEFEDPARPGIALSGRGASRDACLYGMGERFLADWESGRFRASPVPIPEPDTV